MKKKYKFNMIAKSKKEFTYTIKKKVLLNTQLLQTI